MSEKIGSTLGPVYDDVADFSNLQAVYELTPEQSQRKARIDEARAALKIAEAERARLRSEIEKATQECKHPVFTDQDVYPWYWRYCVICGQRIDVL